MSGVEPNENNELSQEDIDAAMAAGAGAEGAEDKTPQGDAAQADIPNDAGVEQAAAAEVGAEELADSSPSEAGDAEPAAAVESGEMSQADIDAAMASADAPEPAAAAESGEMSQADIDAAMAGADTPEPAAAAESGELSQADIDAAMASADAPEPAATAESGELSQADIDAAMAGADLPESEAAEESEGKPMFSQADIDAALAAEDPPDVGETAGAAAPEESPKLDSAGRPFDEAAAMMEAAIAEERAAAEAAAAAAAAAAPPAPAPQAELPPLPAEASPLEMPDFGAGASGGIPDKGIELLNNVDLDVKIELGRAELLIEDVLKLGEGSVVELDKLAGDPVDMLVNDRLVARGEVIVLNDNFCVRISEIVAPQSDWEAA